MDLNQINQKAISLMSQRKAHIEREKGGIYHHGQRTASLALQLREILLPEDTSHDDILTVAGWFHDCAKGIEPHEKYGAVVAREALSDLLTKAEVDKVCDLIGLHCLRQPENNSYDSHTKILQDADLVDHFGIYEIWMNIQYWSHKNGSIEDMIAYYRQNHSEHVSRHRELLNYDLSKQIYDDRISFEKEYINRLMDEGKGIIHKKTEA